MKVGDLISVWWATGLVDKDGVLVAKILQILPYTGRYPNFFDKVLVLYAPNTNRGTTEMAFHSSEFPIKRRAPSETMRTEEWEQTQKLDRQRKQEQQSGEPAPDKSDWARR